MLDAVSAKFDSSAPARQHGRIMSTASFLSQRRHFMAGILGTGLASTLSSHAQNLSYKGENLRFGLVTYNWGKDLELSALLDLLKETEIKGVELRVEHKHGVDVKLTPEQRSAVRTQFTDAGIELIGLGTNFEFHAADQDTVKKNLAGAKEFIKLSHDVGGSGVKVKPNALPKEVEKTLEQIAKSLAELSEYAVGFGQEIRLEVHGGVSDLGHISQIMKMADRDNVRVCWNSNAQDLEGEGIEANFAKVQDYLGATTHVRELTTEGYPWAKLAELLVKADYAGWVCLEGHKPPTGDKVEPLKQQRDLFMGWVKEARLKVKD
jgi:sugar phosphate isomerase/epimerase